MRIAHHIAGKVSGFNGRMYVDIGDVYSFVLGNATLKLLRGGNPNLKLLAIDYLRQLGGDPRKDSHKTKFLHEQLREDEDRPSEPPDYVARLALKRCGVWMLDSLPDRMRHVMLLRYWHGLSQSEAARELEVSPARVGQIEREAAAVIRKALAKRGITSRLDVM